MPKMSSIILVIILAIVIQCVAGNLNQRTVQDREKFIHEEDILSRSKNGAFASSFPENSFGLSCCVYGKCSCNSLDTLANFTNNVLIYITADLMLSSLVKVLHLENVSIIGHNNPTVNCRNAGGLHFTFCHNCIIQGIVWEGCGTKSVNTDVEPILKLSYSSNISIHNCTFQHSIGQAVVLSEVSGNININHCHFVYNSHYRGHGAAVHYSSNNVTNHPQPLLTISHCSFSYNKGAESLLYIEDRLSQHNNIIIQYSKVCHNQDVTPVYVINETISFNGELLFLNNTAKQSAGIYISDHSNITFGQDSNVTFIQNYAHKGGAVFLRNHSIALFDKNSRIKFNYNKATNGTIYSEGYSKVTFTGNSEVTFNSNSATQYGGAICSLDNSHVVFSGKSKVKFNSNAVHLVTRLANGGVIYSEGYGNILFKGTVFSYNIAYYNVYMHLYR